MNDLKEEKEIKHWAEIRKAKPSNYYIYVCEHGCTVQREKNKHREEKGEARGGGGEIEARGCSPGTMSPTC